MTIYKAINAVQSDLSKVGISKDNQNKQQGYKFRGIDDIYNVLATLLSKHGLCILPRVLSRSTTERDTKAGGVVFYTAVEVEFDFVCAEDGSRHIVKTFGEAMDSGDKSTNKAMSAAYKYACLQAFCIPTEGDNDADAQTPEPVIKTIEQKISADDANNIRCALEFAGLTEQWFLGLAKVSSIEELALNRMAGALNAIKKEAQK